MDNEFLNNSDDELVNENAENYIRCRLPKKYIRNGENLIEFYEDEPFKKRYRFNKRCIIEIFLPLVYEQLKQDNRGLLISLIMQLLITTILCNQ